MRTEKIDAQTAFLHLARKVEAEDATALKKVLHGLYEDGTKLVQVNFAETERLHKACLGPLLLYHKKLQDRGGEIKFINVAAPYLKHLFAMLNLYSVISIEEVDLN